MPLYLFVLNLALGLLITWRALVNANNMGRSTRHGIRLLNIALLVAGVAMVACPFASTEAAMLALQAGLGVFVVCMFIGRRPTDRVLGG